MFTDIDGWAVILWVLLLATTIWAAGSDPQKRRHTYILTATAPAILILMAVYACARHNDVWCLGWAITGIFISSPLAVIAIARLTAQDIIDSNKGLP